MNFFEQQDLARRNTTRLVLLLFAAIISLIVVTTALFSALMGYLNYGAATSQQYIQPSGLAHSMINAFSWELTGGITLLICCVVTLGSLYKFIQLRSGGKAVAEAMGGKLIDPHTDNADERKILNVVEEMAIASGTPVPPVYLIEDDAINAFAAGHNPQNAVIGITRGCIHLLKRDELQGVIAHEFSHIFHGDMRINIRLVALLNGILLLGLIGYFMMRSAGYRSISISRSSKDKSPVAIMAAGVALIIIGYTGTFFGNLIKAAVSRQREFLADASAVQFTRNPDGIAGALKKIGGYIGGSKLQSASAAEFSHMYFSQAVSTSFNALMATHPPLEERIKRIEPRWDGQFPAVDPMSISSANDDGGTQHQGTATASHLTATKSEVIAGALATSLSSIGQPTESHLVFAQDTLAIVGDELRIAARDPFSARALIYGLLLDSDFQICQHQWELLRKNHDQKEIATLQKIAGQSMQLDERARLPLVELTLPALKQLSPAQYSVFKRSMHVLITADKEISLMEWALHRIVITHIEGHSNKVHHHGLRELRNECQVLLSGLAYAGAKSDAAAEEAFKCATETLRQAALTLLPRSEVTIERLNEAVNQLNGVKPLQKPQLLKTMQHCIMQDGEITAVEAELFRAIADSLDCPIPPLPVT